MELLAATEMPKNVGFGNIWSMVIFLEVTEKDCIEERYPKLKATISLILHINSETVHNSMYHSVIH